MKDVNFYFYTMLNGLTLIANRLEYFQLIINRTFLFKLPQNAY